MLDPASLDIHFWLAAGAIFVVAGLVHGVLGLGFPMLATPLLAILLDIRSAVLITLLPTVTVNLISILHGGAWSRSIGRYWPLALMIPAGSLAGTYLLISIDPSPLRLLLAAVILLHLVSDRVFIGWTGWVRTRPWLAYLLFGAAAGLLAGSVNVMVPVLIIFALAVDMPAVAMVQVFNLCFLAGKVTQLGAFAYGGMLTPLLVLATLPLAMLAGGALVLGMRVRQDVDGDTYRRWMRNVLVVMAVVLTGQYLAGFW